VSRGDSQDPGETGLHTISSGDVHNADPICGGQALSVTALLYTLKVLPDSRFPAFFHIFHVDNRGLFHIRIVT
jgi:hypothetical protein